MKIIITSIIAFIFISCGVPQQQYDQLQSENKTLQQKTDSLLAEITKLERKPSDLLTDAKLQIKTNDYTSALQTLQRIADIEITSNQNKELLQLLQTASNGVADAAYYKVNNSGSISDYRYFIKTYPKSKYIKKVKLLLLSANYKNIKRTRAISNTISRNENIKSPSINYRTTHTNNRSTTTSINHIIKRTTSANSEVRIGAICFDGSRSFATGRGACSHHGGVRQWLYK